VDRLSLDIASTSARPIPMYLNRPLIALLEHLKVPNEVFFKFQDDAVGESKKIITSYGHAAKMFTQHGLGQSFRLPSLIRNIRELLHLDIAPDTGPVAGVLNYGLIEAALGYGMIHILREIKHRARILIPGSVTLIGVSDEWNCLEEGEIYARIYDPRKNRDDILMQQVLITRSPQIHPGDAQLVKAVNRPEVSKKLGHLRNVVVFSCK
jgi:RNA-dependent RNA polymerase